MEGTAWLVIFLGVQQPMITVAGHAGKGVASQSAAAARLIAECCAN
jgi:hypothetical protein